jgi:hypothetical protein
LTPAVGVAGIGGGVGVGVTPDVGVGVGADCVGVGVMTTVGVGTVGVGVWPNPTGVGRNPELPLLEGVEVAVGIAAGVALLPIGLGANVIVAIAERLLTVS